MKTWRQFLFRARALLRRNQLDAEMREEMRHLLELAAAEKAAEGVPPAEARAAAQRKFGNVGLLQERARDERTLLWLEQLMQDLRYDARAPTVCCWVDLRRWRCCWQRSGFMA